MKQKLMTLSELCNELSISKATGRNWLRLGKISPSKIINGVSFFDHSYVDNIKRDISSGKNTSLKSRRNKKYKSGFDLYNSYVSGTSPNLTIVSDIIAYIKEQEIETDEVLLRALLGECALKLLFMKRHKKAPSPSLEEFYKNTCEVKCRSLIEDLIGDTHEIMKTVKAHRKLFLADYTYIPTEDTLGLLYISLNNIGKRKSLGAYYTPTEVVNKLCDNLFSGKDFLGKEILDPCCGTGNFLLQLPGNISGEQVYGNDIDEISVRLARINYALKYDVSQKDVIYSHITRSDFLQAHGEKKYDYIIGNPPWGSDKPYDVFVEKAVRSLNLNGHIAFVLPEAILSVKAHKDIRSFMLSCCRFEYVEYLGEVFHKVQCPSIILHARYTNEPFNTKGLVINDMGKRYEIKTDRDISNGFLSFRMTDEEYELINTIENIENKVTLKDQAVFALGIVTGDNKQFISDKKSSGKEPVLKGSDIQKYRYTGSCNYILFEPEKFQQVAPADIYRAKEKLLYKFITRELTFAYDDTGILSLNSCNILIPQIPGLGIKYVMAVLNSAVAQFYYSRMFGSVKVLRSYLEQLPIPMADHADQKRITGLVDRLLETKDRNCAESIKAEIDREIAELYGISQNDLLFVVK